jgi:hypothetical protein
MHDTFYGTLAALFVAALYAVFAGIICCSVLGLKRFIFDRRKSHGSTDHHRG